ncbi:MAG: iron-containing alcohol dehydrogenase [Succinivibrio sp.]|jgi:alcohol dehydrogenase YqhD (iron-dependent ADH family)|nr:iron-containing alcohol dehydrogenase [Succinivibrio sp.]
MNSFSFCRPTDFFFGRGAENHAGEYAKKHGGTRVLIHFGGGSAIKSGLIGRIEKSLDEAGIYHVRLGGVKPNPRAELVYEGIELCRKEKLDMVIAAGGGSVLDSAKAICNGVPYAGDFWDFYMGGKKPQAHLPLGTVITIAAAGSEGSDSSVINKVVDGVVRKKGCNLQQNVATFSLMNPELTMTLPPFQTACGACDIMCHVMERYFTNTKEVQITDAMCEGVLRTMVEMFPRVMAHPDDYEARANIMWAGTVAHNNILGVGREQDWGSHRLEMELSAMYDVAHGAGLSVVMPAWMECVMDHDVTRFVQFAHRVFGIEPDFYHPEVTARTGIAALRALWGAAGLPLNFEELGAKREDIPQMVAHITHDDRTEGHFVVMDGPFITKVFEHAADYRRP